MSSKPKERSGSKRGHALKQVHVCTVTEQTRPLLLTSHTWALLMCSTSATMTVNLESMLSLQILHLINGEQLHEIFLRPKKAKSELKCWLFQSRVHVEDNREAAPAWKMQWL